MKSLAQTRRSFIGQGAFAFLAAGCGGRVACGRAPARRPSANERVNLAIIGCGMESRDNLPQFLADARVRVTVACDPVERAMGYGYHAELPGGRRVVKEQVDAHYGDMACRMVADWREVIADPSVDAVAVITPDHWHALISIAAMKAGKHVYCQKPVSHSIREGRALARVAAETGVTFQSGSQQRSLSEFRVACELVRSGYMGEVRLCEMFFPEDRGGCWGHALDRRRLPAPDYFAPGMWDLWQGPARHWENNAFIPGIHEPMQWRWNSRTGSGTMADWGAHHFDILQWAAGADGSGPVLIENMAHSNEGDEVFSWPGRFSCDIVYANGFRGRAVNNPSDRSFPWRNGIVFHCEKGKLCVKRGRLALPDFLKKWNEKRDLKDTDVHLHKSRASHEADFIDSIFSGERPAADAEVGHRAATICHLANACIVGGSTSIRWDPVAEKVTEGTIPADILEAPMCNGWKLEN